jgi:hypothetical protein
MHNTRLHWASFGSKKNTAESPILNGRRGGDQREKKRDSNLKPTARHKRYTKKEE